MIDVIDNQLAFPLFGIGKLHYAYSLLGVIEMDKEFVLYLVPTVNALRCKVGILIKDIPLERSNRLFD